MIRVGLRRVRAAGKRLLIHMTDLHGAMEAKQDMPDCLIFNREVFGTHDGSPRGIIRRSHAQVRAVVGPRRVGGGWWTGEEWFNRFWPYLSMNVGADVQVFCNEWFSNKQPHDEVDRFALFYMQLMDVCTRHQVVCTIGDFSVGTPGYPAIPDEAYDVPAFQAMLRQAEAQGHYLNMHGYDLHDGVGLVPREYSILRYKTLTAGHPNLKVIAGELANDGLDVGHKDGLYGGEKSIDFMKAYHELLNNDPQFVGGCWWLVCNDQLYTNMGEARWDLDSWYGVLNEYFDWVVSS